MRSTTSAPLSASRSAAVARATISSAPLACAERDEPGDGREQAVERGGGHAAGAGDDVAEAQHLLLLAQRLERPVGTGLDDEQVQGVAAEIEGGDAHQAGGGR